MKIVKIIALSLAAAAVGFSASCCPVSAPSHSTTPTYIAPAK